MAQENRIYSLLFGLYVGKSVEILGKAIHTWKSILELKTPRQNEIEEQKIEIETS